MKLKASKKIRRMRQNLKEYLVPPPCACLKLPFSVHLKRSSEKSNLRLGGRPGQEWSKSLCCFNQTTLSGVATGVKSEAAGGLAAASSPRQLCLQEGRLWGKPKCRHPKGTLISEFSSRDTPGSEMTGRKSLLNADKQHVWPCVVLSLLFLLFVYPLVATFSKAVFSLFR